MPTLLSSQPRVPLRERCNIALRVDTSANHSRCRPRKPAKRSLQIHQAQPETRHVVNIVQRPSESRDRCMGEVIPGMFVAFHEDQDTAVKVSGAGKQFSHVISISPSNTPGRVVEYSSLHNDDSQIRALHLTVPHYRPAIDTFHAPRLSLSSSQIRAARDFLSLALPYTSESSPTAWSTASTRLLITTPFNRPVDAVCIVAAYLSFTSGEDVCDVLNGIDNVEELPGAWKRKVFEDDAEIVQVVAEEEMY